MHKVHLYTNIRSYAMLNKRKKCQVLKTTIKVDLDFQ